MMESNRRSDSYVTPCRQVCQLDKSDICKGCGRTKEQITKWSRMTYYERMKIMKELGYGVRRRRKSS